MSSSENIRSKTISDIIKKWFLNSPSNGIRRIGRAKTLITALFCGYIFWVFTVLMGCFINIIIINYIAHPTKIHLTVTQDRNPDYFPAVTFCNINPLKDDLFLSDIRNHRLPGAESSSSLNESEYRKAVSAYMERILADQVKGPNHPFVEWGFKLDDLLITCIFNTQLCDQNLTQIFHPDYGNCYTFDNRYHVQKGEMNNIDYDWSIHDENGDVNYKLFLELFLHQKDYNEYLDHRAAFRIFLHRKYEIPILSEHSLFLGPNKYTKLSFLPRVMSFSQHCQNGLTDRMKETFLTRRVRYTQALCYKLCEDHFIVKRCQCIDPKLAVFYQFFNNNQTTTNIHLCAFDDPCLISRGYFNATELCPECLPECVNIQYSVQSSYAYYPNIKASEKVLQRVRNHFRLDQKVNAYLNNASDGLPSNRRTRLHDNIVAVEISASPYATETLTESPVYTWVDLISSIGGQTALWIGVSLISFVEIMELLYLLLERFYSYIFFCKKK